ncbi:MULTISPECIES: aspartate-semialdehyde dehydrogenase [Erysipelotrichaceae]|jgi:aspartate-semialdehyde dehydrogenase|uniref:aspartate-semialdehyde dehydrogenase n=1 Tax=Erysipelotrichaceae TaxID=128827 RepID=UPI000CF98FD8|nr:MULTISPECIES: aspartate-semialdehyde dehydrogenase [Erysipelotrichaceae]MCI2154066.1 aspartate-semialdehyde dehydrogenase [Solobacterium sp.]MDD5880815.1 aspartate-semialdehyde dehydrogenase [Stecheria intestinalis]MDD6366858.1 aspartate-semialdehyde dehydrogenase [Stecheria intestinalis]
MRIGILGATGAVGRQMMECLEEQKIIPDDLILLASPRSEGKVLPFAGKELMVHAVNEAWLEGLDYVLGAVDADTSRKWAPAIRNSGAVYIDNSSAFRLEEDIPLVVPEINGADALNHHGIIANPNCSTIITLMAIAPIHQISPIRKVIASTYQAVSGAGMHGIDELEQEVKDIAEGKAVKPSVFPAQIAYNCIPWIGSEKEAGYTSEELKMRNEGRKILHNPEMKVTCTCVRVPVFRSHSISVSVECEQPVSVEAAAEAISQFEGDVYLKDGYPMPLNTSGQDKVYVGRLRPDMVFDGGLSLFCCGDQIRKGAAANAVQILAYLLKH